MYEIERLLGVRLYVCMRHTMKLIEKGVSINTAEKTIFKTSMSFSVVVISIKPMMPLKHVVDEK